MGAGPKIHTDNLLFGFDTGKTSVDDNSFNYSKYLGEPTVNHITNPGTSNTGWTGHGWTGGQVISTDYPNTYEFTATNGWHNRTFDTGVTSGGTVQVTFEYKLKQWQTTQTQIFVLNGTHLGSYTNYIGNGAMSFEWQTFNGTFTANSDSKIAIGPRGSDSSGLTDIVYIRNLQVETKSHRTPFVDGSRTSTNSLIDLKGNTGIDVSNISFDTSGQPTFDGTDDYLQPFDLNLEAMEASTLEAIIYMDDLSGSHNSYSIFGGVATGNRHGYHEIRNSGSGWKMTYWTSSNGWRYANTALSAGQYYHVVWVWKDLKCCWYVNGEDDGYYNFTTFSPYSLGAKTIGYFPNERYMDGHIPIARVYNKALTESEISSNYKAYKNRFNLS